MTTTKPDPRRKEGALYSEPVPPGTSTTLREPLTLRLPLPPSVNNLYCTVFGRRVLSAEGKKFKRFVASRVPVMVPHLGEDEWLRLEICCYLPLRYKNGKRRKWDATNYVKVLEDALAEPLGVDDSAMIAVSVEKSDSPDWFVVASVSRAA